MNLRWRWDDLVEGIRSGYPLCCVLRFTLAWNPHDQAIRRTGTNDLGGYVCCDIFHHGEPWRWDYDDAP